MAITAVERWGSDLGAWALPEELLSAVDRSPYGTTPEVEKRMAESPEAGSTPTLALVESFAGPGGSVVDVGAGSGRLSLTLAETGCRVTAVEKSEERAQALRKRPGAEQVTIIVGSWPMVAGNTGLQDVALSAHVAYDVAAIAPFIHALDSAARRAVVLEVTPAHPWAGLTPYYLALHGLDRPKGPTAEDLAEVVAEVVGLTPEMRVWSSLAPLRFHEMGDLLDFYRRRLLVPSSHSIEAGAMLEADVHETDEGWLTLGPPERDTVTLWWRT